MAFNYVHEPFIKIRFVSLNEIPLSITYRGSSHSTVKREQQKTVLCEELKNISVLSGGDDKRNHNSRSNLGLTLILGLRYGYNEK